MCGRFYLYALPEQIAETLRARIGPGVAWDRARYNIAPTQDILIVRPAREGEAREIVSARWGLVPGWAKQLGKQREPINARSETVAEKKPFADLYKRADRRCLVVANGWYEWLRSENPKQPRIPFRYTVDDDEQEFLDEVRGFFESMGWAP